MVSSSHYLDITAGRVLPSFLLCPQERKLWWSWLCLTESLHTFTTQLNWLHMLAQCTTPQICTVWADWEPYTQQATLFRASTLSKIKAFFFSSRAPIGPSTETISRPNVHDRKNVVSSVYINLSPLMNVLFWKKQVRKQLHFSGKEECFIKASNKTGARAENTAKS